ncbi:hypothetical protein [Angelakisella massiliensis]|uniref:hypothetical protein n=1 Tax=Angelakisella massiliensis TaxID=1871018 RepID=UPI0023A8EF07|nr:hypothetical protein [Angelakisella massiliensis]
MADICYRLPLSLVEEEKQKIHGGKKQRAALPAPGKKQKTFPNPFPLNPKGASQLAQRPGPLPWRSRASTAINFFWGGC